MMHLLCLTFRFQLSSEKTILSAAFRVNLESAMRVPKTQSIFHLCAHDETRSIAMRVNLRNQKKLSCVWIFHDGPGRKISDIDILVLFRQIRTRDHAFPAWDRNSIGQTSFCFFHIRG